VTAPPSEQGRRILDEALRLLDVAQAARPAGTGQVPAPHAPPPHPAPECRICPFCRGVAYLREVDPQAVERLSGAVAELVGAVRDLLGAGAGAEAGAGPAPAPREAGDGEGATAEPPGTRGAPVVPWISVQRIDVTD